MPKSEKENLSPALTRKSKLPVPKSCDVKRKRLDNSPLCASSRKQAMPRSPKSCGRVHFAGYDTGDRKNIQARRKLISDCKTPLKNETPKVLVKKNMKDFLAAQYSQEDIEFKSDQSALQSILDGTGIQSPPSSGASQSQMRHTLAAAPFQRTSIYAPPQKLGLDDFKKMCEEFAKVPSKLSSSTDRSSRILQPVGQQSIRIHTENQCNRRLTCGSRCSPKRRCLEKSSRTGNLGNNCKADHESKPAVQQSLKSMFSMASHGGSAVTHKTAGSSLGILVEENTEDMGSTLGRAAMVLTENEENIDRQEADGKTYREILTPKRRFNVTDGNMEGQFTPVRVMKQFKHGYNTASNTEPRLRNITEAFTPRFFREDGKCNIDNPRTPSRVLKKETSEALTPLREPKWDDRQVPTPSRVPKDKRIADISTPGRKPRQENAMNHTPQRVPRVQNKENVSTPTRELKQTSIFAAPMRVLKQSRNRMDVESKSTVSEKVPNVSRAEFDYKSNLFETAKSTDVQELFTECTEGEQHDTETKNEPFSSVGTDGRGRDEIEEKAVWKTKTTACKTPIKQEILTSVVDQGRNIERHHEEQVDGCKTDETFGIRNDKSTTENKATYSIFYKQEATQDFRIYTATMQLPVVKSPVDKSGPSPEMPDLGSSNWNRSKTGTSLGQGLIFDKHLTGKKAVSQSLIVPEKAYNRSTTNQNWIECLQEDLERKLLELRKASEEEKETTHLNFENNNVVTDDDEKNDVEVEDYILSTNNMDKTAGQLTTGFSQGYHDNDNAIESRTFDINSNLGTSKSNAKTLRFRDNSSYEESPSHLTDVNLTSVMSRLKESSSKSPKEQEVLTPYILRKTDLTDKVVYPSNVLKNTVDEMPKATESYAMSQKHETEMKVHNACSRKDKMTMEEKDTKEEKFPEVLTEPVLNVNQQLGDERRLTDSEKEIDISKEVKLYAPTPSKERWSGPDVSQQHENVLHLHFPLMTPLALRMVAQEHQSIENTPTCSLKECDTIHQADDEKPFGNGAREKCKIDDTLNKCLQSKIQSSGIIEDTSTTSLAETPPKHSAFYVVKQTALSPLVGSLSLRGNTESHGKQKLRSRPQEVKRKKIFMSMNERYKEALLDEEVTRFATRLVEQRVGYFPRGCCNPVAKILMEGDDMHFVPIESSEMEESVTYSIPGSAFSKYRFLVE